MLVAMKSQRRTLRVALLDQTVRGLATYELMRGVLAYKQRAERWQLVGTIDEPFIDPSKIDRTVVDGVIGFFDEPHWADTFRAAGVAAVNTSSVVKDMPLTRVSTDNLATGQMGAEYLLERGYAHFAFVGSHGWHAEQRLEGFRGVIERVAGRVCHVFDRDVKVHEQPHLLDRWLKDVPKPVAVLATNDRLARRVIERVIGLGLRVPDDVAVLGVGNDPWLTQLASVPMSSIEQNFREIGFEAAQMLDALMTGTVPEQARWIPPLGVATRASTDIIMAEDPVVRRAHKFISEHCHNGITVDDVLDAVDVSRRTLELHLKRAFGRTPQQMIFRAQVERARRMLVMTDAPIYRIAAECGLESQQRLSFMFKRQTGMTPMEYRRRFGNH